MRRVVGRAAERTGESERGLASREEASIGHVAVHMDAEPMPALQLGQFGSWDDLKSSGEGPGIPTSCFYSVAEVRPPGRKLIGLKRVVQGTLNGREYQV